MTLSQDQLQRIKVVENVVEGRIGVARATELLDLSRRQVQRLKQRYQAHRADWVFHGNQGRPPANRIPDPIRRQVLALAREKYAGFNDCHFHEKLVREEHLELSRPSVRRILRQAGQPSPQKRRPSKYRSRRERREQEGMMLQTDGSQHDWLEGRGPGLTLLAFVDDATSRVPAGRFQLEAEDAAGYMTVFRRVVEEQGIPLSVYRDQHGVFQRNDDHWSLQEQFEGAQWPTQFGRVLQELGVVSIPAHSPQAKGRIERLWRTFQDRLISELRLAGASTLEQANDVLDRFLPQYNRQFGKPAARSGSAYRPLDRRLDLDYIFSLRYERTVNRDHTISFGPRGTIQLPPLPGRRSYAGQKVEVCQLPQGDLKIYVNRRLLDHQSAGPAPVPVRAQPRKRSSTPRPHPLPRIYAYAGRPALL